VTQDVAQNAFLAFGGSPVLSATGKYRGLYVAYDDLTRNAGAPILEGVRIKLPADYTNFGASFAGYFEGDGRSVTLCDTTYALSVVGLSYFNGKVGIGLSPTANMLGLSIEDGLLTLKERATPTADGDYGKIYTKDDNKLYFQDGAGVEHEIAYVP